MAEPVIAPTALVHPGARLADDVVVGHCSVVHAGVGLAAGTVVEEFCLLGSAPEAPGAGALEIGAGSRIRSHSVVHGGSRFGPGLQTGHHALLRAGVVAGRDLRIGSYSSVEGDAELGDHVRVHGYAQIGKGSKVASLVWIYSQVTLTNDPLPPSHLLRPVTVGRGAVLCVGVTVLPGAVVGEGAFIAAGATVSGDVPDAALVLADGSVAGPVTALLDLPTGTRHPYPRHFSDAYPAEAASALAELQAHLAVAARAVPRPARRSAG
ncbi:hypothetical protein [Kineococcus sp. SYSU DK018]|uniref:hypothetical protein n=1 Tax=Kineococcus sp. SYSU DK018 TaxID=3383139 RepID=UPI003D7E8475